jgi:hypothetical protein
MLRRALPSIACVALASSCIWDRTLDSAQGRVRVKLTSHFEGVPVWGTSRNFHLEVAGYEPLSVFCTATQGEVSEAPEGRRAAYQCGDGWKVVYLEAGALFPACSAAGSSMDWAREPQFQSAAPSLAQCNELPALVKALKDNHGASPEQIGSFIVQVFERGPSVKFATELKGLPGSLQDSVRAALSSRLTAATPVSAQQLTELIELYGLDDDTEPQVLSKLAEARPSEPDQADALVRLILKQRGVVSAAKAACVLTGDAPADGIALGVLSQTTISCPRFEQQITDAMEAPALACSGNLQCKDNACTAALPESWDHYTRFHEDDQQRLLLHAAVLRGLAPRDLALAVQRREYVLEMPQRPSCEEAKPGAPCQCEVQLCSVARSKQVDEFDHCRVTFDDRRKHATVTAR